jgi:hypothetical protein
MLQLYKFEKELKNQWAPCTLSSAEAYMKFLVREK